MEEKEKDPEVHSCLRSFPASRWLFCRGTTRPWMMSTCAAEQGVSAGQLDSRAR